MIVTLIILGLSVVLFVSGKIRSDVVALSSLLLLMLFDILTPEEALSGFSNSIVIMMVGLFVVGGGIFQTGLAKIISNKLMSLAGNNQKKLYLLVMLVTASIGGFVSNTGTVALLLPIVVSMAATSKTSPSMLLMPLAFASSMGGMMTLIGTPPNLVINNTLIANGFESLSFFSFLPLGLICVAIGTVALWPLCKFFLSKKEDKGKNDGAKKSLGELATEYQVTQNLYRVRVRKNSEIANKAIQELDIRQQYDVSIFEIRRKSTAKNIFNKPYDQIIASPDTVISPEDVLYVIGDYMHVHDFAEKCNLEWIDNKENCNAPTFSGKLQFDEIGLAEVVIMSNSGLVNHKVKNIGFRENYQVNVLSIQRGGQYIVRNLKDERIASGDSLLIQGEWKDIARMNDLEGAEWVVVGQPLSEASKVTRDHKAPLAAIIMVGMVVCMAFNIIPAVTAVILAAVLMVLTGCLRNVEAAYKTINWESIVLIGAMLPMSLALEKTGTSVIISNALVNGLGSYGPTALLAGIYLGTSLLTLFISNTATAVLFAPIAMRSAMEMGISPYPLLFAVTVAASMCFASPFSTPPNALVMSAGRYTFMDYVKVGVPLQLIYALVMILVLPLLFPF